METKTAIEQSKTLNGFMVESCKNEEFTACSFMYAKTEIDAQKIESDIKLGGNYAKIVKVELRECALCGKLTEELYCLRCDSIRMDCINDAMESEKDE